MRYEEFLKRVQTQAKLGSQDEAVKLIHATLETLGERIYRSQRDGLAAQLPDELKSPLRARTEPENTRQEVERFALEEFYNRVSARTGLAYARTVTGVKTVMDVLREATASGEWDDLRARLPDEYDKILS